MKRQIFLDSKIALWVVGAFLMTVVLEGHGMVRNGAGGMGPKVMCGPDTLMIYQDCKLCTCPMPNRPAKCQRKSCDLRTKDGGQCPPAILKLDDQSLCEEKGNQIKGCKVDSDCPGPQFCCFDFCLGSRCMNPVPLEGKLKVHQGRGYP